MAITNGYATLTQVKDALETSETVHDTLLELAIESASRAIDRATDRRFYQDTNATARYYTPESWDGPLQVDDIATVTGLVVVADFDGDGTFEETLTVDTDFYMSPRNAAADGRPWTELRRLIATATVWPVGVPDGVKVTAKYGYGATAPTDITQATIIQAVRLFNRKHAPFGVAGSPTEGSEMRLLARLDPDVAMMVRPYRRLVVA